MLLVSLAPVEANRAFFAARWPDARVVADPDGALFDAFGRRRARLLELLGPRVLLRALAALLRGHGVGRPQGDPTRLPGTFVVAADRVLWAQAPRDIAEQPDLEQLAAIAARPA